MLCHQHVQSLFRNYFRMTWANCIDDILILSHNDLSETCSLVKWSLKFTINYNVSADALAGTS